MVSLDIVKSCNAALLKSQPLVAVITGGTSGIGEHTIRTLATIHGGEGKGLRVYIVGRKEAAATAIIADCLKVCPGGDFRFVQAGDLSLLKDVDHVSAEIIKAEEAETKNGEKPRIDFLVMGHAFLAFEARQGSTLLPRPPFLPFHHLTSFSIFILDLSDITFRNQRRPRRPILPPILLSHAPHNAAPPLTSLLVPPRPRRIRLLTQTQ